ncbi:MAG: DNA integrity scanning protein DisA nucleotide-binding domain protein [Deltaproteobacteria bacterium]|nr:DNA integrity scanning protein DisA nucleotide-binding domain protein [Deltaproteobacteria bacterium]
MLKLWNELVLGFRVQDIFDVLIISVLLYGLLLFMTRTASRFVLWGITLLGLVYLAARAFDLYLTAVVLQGFFTVLIVALIVIFQEDLRRFFERLATWPRRRKAFSQGQEAPEIQVIAQAAAFLAQLRRGALIVIEGEEPLDRHLEGGVPLDGEVSEPLLDSLFDPHSAGHDGAVVLSGKKVRLFGAHLPLSQNAAKFGLSGLRHTAALGLAERSDALCVVVSEEGGTISVAKDGAISQLENPNELRGILEVFYASMAPQDARRPLVGWLRTNPGKKILALALAVTLWLAFGLQKDIVRRELVFPIEYRTLSEHWVIQEASATRAQVTLQGPEAAFRLLDPSSLAVSVDLSKITEGEQEIVLSSRMVKVPANLSLASIRPSTVTLVAQKLNPVEVPVEVQTQGNLPAGLTLAGTSVDPPMVTVWAVPETKGGLKIQTVPVDLAKITQTSAIQTRLQFPAGVKFLEGQPPTVQVTVRIMQAEKNEPAGGG